MRGELESIECNGILLKEFKGEEEEEEGSIYVKIFGA